jgi:hypothetical protein
MKEVMTTDKSLRVRGNRWNAIEKLAWDFMQKEKRFIKPSDVADALLWKSLKNLTIEDLEKAKEDR